MYYDYKPRRRYIKGFSANGLAEALIIILAVAAVVTLFFYLADRALRINTDNYCSHYPTAVSCQLSTK